MQNARRASFSARLPIETCDRLTEQGYIDLHYTPGGGRVNLEGEGPPPDAPSPTSPNPRVTPP